MHFVKKKVAGKAYLSIAETHRVNGVPKTTIVKYVGSAEKLFKILIGLHKEETESHRGYQYAAPLALHQIAEEIKLIETINRHTKKKGQGFSVGEYLRIITLNRALYPRSKRGIRRWYERTIFPFILRIAPEKLTSHAFGEHMEYLNEEAIERIEKELSSRIIELYDINTECLLYDITNFYTFIQEHEGNELPKKGKSKAKRFDLNQINLALLVTKDGGIPLMHQAYEGNRHDAKKFPEIISKLADRFVMFSKNVEVAEKEGNITLDYAVNRTVYNEKLKSFGKTIVFTNNHEWSTAQIIRVYRSKAKIEDDFKRMKSPIMISLEPVYHWTDQKIRVHAFCCVLALMLLLLLKRKLQMADVKLSLERMIEELSDVQLSVIKFYDVDKRLCILNELNEEQKAMFAVRDLMRYKKLVSTKLH